MNNIKRLTFLDNNDSFFITRKKLERAGNYFKPNGYYVESLSE